MTNETLKLDEERAKFEKWARTKNWSIKRDWEGDYKDEPVNGFWIGWLARAQLETSS
jgi:hypothetical protein